MKKRTKWIMIGAVACVLAIFGYYSSTQGIEAETEKVLRSEISQYIEDTATVKSRESQTVYAEGGGKMVKIYADVGDTVKKDDLIIVLDKTDLELQLRDAQAKVDASMAQLKGTEIANYANRIGIAKAAYEQAKIMLDTAKKDYENAKILYEAEALSEDEFSKARAAYNTAMASLRSAESALDEAKLGATDYVREAYRAQLEQSIVYRDTIAQNLKKQEIRSPIDGVILEKLVEENSVLAPGTPVFVIGDTKNLEIEADILADDAVKIAVGNEVEISGKATNDTIIKGKIVKIAPAAKSVTSALGVNQKRVPVTIELTEDSSILKPGYNVDIKIITMVRKDVLKVRDSAVFEYEGEDHVFVVESGKTVLRKVKRGIEGSDSIEILEGLQEGETVLVKPDNDIKEGMKIKVSSSAQ